MLYCGEEIGTGVDPKVGFFSLRCTERMSDAVNDLRGCEHPDPCTIFAAHSCEVPSSSACKLAVKSAPEMTCAQCIHSSTVTLAYL